MATKERKEAKRGKVKPGGEARKRAHEQRRTQGAAAPSEESERPYHPPGPRAGKHAGRPGGWAGPGAVIGES